MTARAIFRFACRTATAVALLACAGVIPVAAQERYPSRPIQLIVPSPPGGGTDIFGRQLAELVEPILGQKLVVENKPGGGGTVGTTLVTQARPDGYTLGMIWNSPLTTSPHSLQVPYTPDSYTPIIQIGSSSYVLCTAPDFPAANGKEFIAHLKQNPGKYTYGNDGVGGTMQLAAERIFGEFGAKVRPVPFGGAGETARNFLGGHVDFYGGSLPPILPHVAAGKAKCLVLTSAANNPALPAASGLADLGAPGAETVLWWGVIGPKGLPADRVQAIEAAFRKAAESPRFKEVQQKQGATAVIRGSDEMAKLIRSEHAALGAVAQSLGLQRK
jgi:tripartite-type tricarboxylate transporter receptor subunit TctC